MRLTKPALMGPPRLHEAQFFWTQSAKIRRMADVPNTPSVPDFESALKRLEEIVKRLESGDLSLDSSLELFEEGIKLSRFCHTKLEQAERRVEILLKNSSGQTRPVPFETENEDSA